MATSGAGFDAVSILREALPSGLSLDPSAQALLDQLISAGADRLSSEPHRVQEAVRSMQRLGSSLKSGGQFAPVDANQLQLRLRDLCPLFPIC